MVMNAGEIAAAHSLLILSLIFQWDAYYVPGSKQFLAFVSHDGFVEITAGSAAFHQRLYNRFTRGGWSPTIEGP